MMPDKPCALRLYAKSLELLDHAELRPSMYEPVLLEYIICARCAAMERVATNEASMKWHGIWQRACAANAEIRQGESFADPLGQIRRASIEPQLLQETTNRTENGLREVLTRVQHKFQNSYPDPYRLEQLIAEFITAPPITLYPRAQEGFVVGLMNVYEDLAAREGQVGFVRSQWCDVRHSIFKNAYQLLSDPLDLVQPAPVTAHDIHFVVIGMRLVLNEFESKVLSNGSSTT